MIKFTFGAFWKFSGPNEVIRIKLKPETRTEPEWKCCSFCQPLGPIAFELITDDIDGDARDCSSARISLWGPFPLKGAAGGLRGGLC